MAEFRIRNVPLKVANRIGTLAKEKGYSSRNALVVDILTKYAVLGDDMYFEHLPETTAILTRSLLTQDSERLEKMLEYSLATIKKIDSLLVDFDL